MRARLVPSRRLAVLYVLALGGLVATALASHSARVSLRTPFVPREERTAPASAPLDGREISRGRLVRRLELSTPDGPTLLKHEELHLFLETGEPGLPMAGAELRLRGRNCAYVAPGTEVLTALTATPFSRTQECARLLLESGPVALDLTVELSVGGPVTLLAFQAQESAKPALLQVAPGPSRPTPLNVRGAAMAYPSTAPRVELLSHMWRLGRGTAWLFALVALATGLACAGCLVFPIERSEPDEGRRSARAALRAGGGAALFAASLALLYATLAPPLSGPDEPYHLLGFADLVQDQALAEDTVRWMGETHLWRIRQQPAERFRTVDVGRPYVVGDDQLRPTEVAMRSAILARLWRAVAPVVRGPAPRALLALRLVNVIVFAIAVAAAAVLAIHIVSAPYPQWLVFPFLFVPALPFYAMHVSETALLCAVYVLLATSIAAHCSDGPRAHWAGGPLGLAVGLMLAGGRSPWPLATLVAAVLLGRAALGSCASKRPTHDAVVFWVGFGIGASSFFAVVDEPYRLMTETYAVHLAVFLPAALRGSVVWLLTQPLAAAVLATAGWALERLLARLRERLAARAASVCGRMLPALTAALSLGVVVSLLGSLLIGYPQLPTEATYSMPAGERVAAVLATMGTMFRLVQPNFLLASSFWVGFGWLDTMPGPVPQGMLMALVGLTLVALLRNVGRTCDVRRFLWLVVVASGATLALVVYSVATQGSISTLVGRHLVGWYLSVLAVIGTALTLDRESVAGAPIRNAASSGAGRAAVLLAVGGSIHAYCLWFILQRYF